MYHRIEPYFYASRTRTLLVLGQIAAVSAWHNNAWLTFAAVAVLAALFLISLKLRPGYVRAFFLFGFLGAAAEFFPVQYGAWSYSTAVPYGLPAYLPIIWGTAGVAIIHMTHKLGWYGSK